MTVTISRDIAIEGPHTMLVSGTASADARAAGVEIYANDQDDLGPATVNADGTWTYDAYVESSVGLRAVSKVGNEEAQTSDLLQIGTNSPLEHQTVADLLTGDSITATVYGARGRALYDVAVQFGDGSVNYDITGRGGPGIAYSGFVRGTSVIENFRAGGRNHDTLNLADTGLQSMAEALQHTTMNDGSATIHFDQTSSVTLAGVTKQDMMAHKQDFVFTGGQVLS